MWSAEGTIENTNRMEPNEEIQAPSRWWLSPDGELVRCDDHEFVARQILRKQPGYAYTGVHATYALMFSSGWIRVVNEAQHLCFDAHEPLTLTQRTVLRNLSIECGCPLYDTLNGTVLGP
jgi:hypothetical protein